MRRIEMGNSIYLGDIDPNNRVNHVRHIRRTIMFQLLIWDSIVLSDSQLITDPRIHLLMGSENLPRFSLSINGKKLEDAAFYEKGIEALIQCGMIEVAQRTSGERQYSLQSVWEGMNGRTDSKVPFLPESDDYARFLDTLVNNPRTYSLDKIGSDFKTNLLSGIGNSVELSQTDRTDDRLLYYMNQDKVLFSDLLCVIREARDAGLISDSRYLELYHYIYGCYSINIPKNVDCHLISEVRNLPLHLDSGIGDLDGTDGEVVDNLRPTWALNPIILDFISFEDFVEIRKQLFSVIPSSKLIGFFSDSLSEKDAWEFNSIWSAYTMMLESSLKLALMKAADERKDKSIELLAKSVDTEDFLDSVVKQKRKDGALEVIKSAVGVAPIPVAGTVTGVYDLVKAGKQEVSFLTKKGEFEIKRSALASAILHDNIHVITKY